MKEIISIVGWVVGIQGALGAAGRIFGGESWGLLHKWWDIPTPGYLALFVVGTALAVWGESSKKRARSSG
ncbi:hypothetical protein OG302_19140 [Streptomyces sp. NBC_01283]|uniref:hypothetical protein n=1 Tax=Streptomyces sp. NBC_01283 TaxID=2903812 RepID=UPI00352C15AD|nr:hypothetical protein OG302_19140 [Streptomyces sp. NBC_01283]